MEKQPVQRQQMNSAEENHQLISAAEFKEAPC